MSPDGQIVLLGVFLLSFGAYILYRSKNESFAQKMSNGLMNAPNFLTKGFYYSKEYFQALDFSGGLFFIFLGFMCLISRTEFSETALGKYILEFLIVAIFAVCPVCFIGSYWRLRK
jgi:hypothetical protein